jgi:hypothetical protein
MHRVTVAVDVMALCCCSVTAQTPAPRQQRVWWLVGGTKRFAAPASLAVATAAVATADCTAVADDGWCTLPGPPMSKLQ